MNALDANSKNILLFPKRSLDYALGIVGAGMAVGSAALFARQSSFQTSSENLWSFVGVALIEIALLGPMGLIGLALDNGDQRRSWGKLSWAVVGALTSPMFLGLFSAGLLSLAVLAFVAAALMADRRKGRRSLPNLAFAAGISVTNVILLIAALMVAHLFRSAS